MMNDISEEKYIQIELENGDIYTGILCNDIEDLDSEIKGKFITLDEIKKNGEEIFYNESNERPLNTIRIRKDKIIAYMTYKKAKNM